MELEKRKVFLKRQNRSAFVHEMTGEQRDAWEAAWSEYRKGRPDGDMRGFKAVLIVHTLRDDQGAPLYTMEQLPEVLKESGRVLAVLSALAVKLNGIGSELDEIEKNSEGDLSV